MSRSYKKTPITGYTLASSAKGYKKLRASEERAKQRALLDKLVQFSEDFCGYEELSGELVPWNEWACERDGKHWFDAKKHPELLRK